MSGLLRAVGCLRCLRGALGLLLLGWALAGTAQVLTLEQARLGTRVQGEAVTTGRDATLPFFWDGVFQGRRGTATVDLHFRYAAAPDRLYALHFLRLGNAYEIWLNGILLQRAGGLDDFDGSDFSKVPRYVPVAAQLLRADNHLRVVIRADAGRRSGVSRVVFGPEEEVRPRYESDARWRQDGSLVVASLSVMVGLLGLFLWFTRREIEGIGGDRLDRVYLFVALSELCWALRVGDALIDRPPLPWPAWSVVMTLAISGWLYFLYGLCVTLAGWYEARWSRNLRRVILVVVLVGPLASLWAVMGQAREVLTVWYGVMVVLYLTFAVIYVWHALRSRELVQRMLALAVVVNVLVGARDWLVFRFSDSLGANTYTRYSSLLFGLTMAYAVIVRYRQVAVQVQDLMDNLAERIARRERELAASYAEVERLARQEERTRERARILSDMHDGVGSHLSVAIRMVESGQAASPEVLKTLRESLDQLKLSIDAVNLPAGDLTALLASLHYRLEPRLKASGIVLAWEVDLLPPLAGLEGPALRQLQFMVFEAISNVLQHAQASALRIALQAAPGGGARLQVIDNGRGFDPERVRRKGLASLRERAAAIGARLAVSSTPGRTVVEITLG